MSFLSNLFQKDTPQQPIIPEKKVSGVELSTDAMKTVLKTSESLALLVFSGVKNLSEVISNVHLQDEHINGFESLFKEANKSLNEIYSITEQMQQFVDTQSNAMAQSVSSIDHMSSSITSVSTDISKRLAITKGLSEAAIDGNDKVKKVLDVVKVLSENMESIKTVISSINAISAQTNMLAMNAAIEAAHAGQAGRGFSVVADEIRQLSEVTRRNAINITETVKNTMTALDEVRNTVNKASAAMLWIEEEVTNASSSFHAIIENMQKLQEDGTSMTKTAQGIDASGSDLKNRSSAVTSGLKTVADTMHELTSLEQHIKQNAYNIASSAVYVTSYFQDAINAEGELQSVLDAAINAANTFERKEPFPFTSILLKHLLWVARVRGILDGTVKTADVNVNHNTCDLGKWIDAQKGTQYASLPAFQTLNSAHEDLHNLVKEIAFQNNKVPRKDLEIKYTQLLKTSERVIDALTKLRTSIH
ncbi:MAG: methyl-accepting chemotaxis protein [Treponema sp.]|jgi:methyl-accepting chemotaxis protein|nr:methyl-accepting chemotaxis protein [Treponema sp.]